MISVSATTARSWTVRPLPANHRCLTSQVASVSSNVMSLASHLPRPGPGKHRRPDSGTESVTLPEIPKGPNEAWYHRPATYLGSRLGVLAGVVAFGAGPVFAGGRELEPVEPVPGQRQQVAELADLRERHPAHALHRRDADEAAQVELHRLREPGQVVDAQDAVGAVSVVVRGLVR